MYILQTTTLSCSDVVEKQYAHVIFKILIIIHENCSEQNGVDKSLPVQATEVGCDTIFWEHTSQGTCQLRLCGLQWHYNCNCTFWGYWLNFFYCPVWLNSLHVAVYVWNWLRVWYQRAGQDIILFAVFCLKMWIHQVWSEVFKVLHSSRVVAAPEPGH